MEKKYLIILLVALVGLKTHAQTNASMPTDSTLHIGLNTYVHPVSFIADNIVQQDYQHYLRTAKTLKIVGWTSLGIGVPSMVFGLYWAFGSAYNSSTNKSSTASDLMFYSGAVLTLSSIPLFIVSHHYKTKGNKLKAISVSLGSQQVFVPQGNGFTSSVQPALSVRVSL